MTNGEFIYISVDVFPDEYLADNSFWATGDENDEKAKKAFMSVYHVRSLEFLLHLFA